MTRALTALTCCALCLASLAMAADLPNLAANPGFEAKAANGLPEGWNGPTPVYTHATDPVHSGQGALRFVNPDASAYRLCNQLLPLKPGRMYEFSVWVKCEDIVGADSGATICLEWYTADDKYLGGAYPSGIKGTQDWTKVRGLSGRVPENAAKCRVVCYVRQRMTGQAWWDDVEVKQWLEPPLQTMLVKPNYRGLITPQTKQIELVAQLKLEDYGLKPEQTELSAQIVERRGGAALRTVRLSPTSATARLALPAAGLPGGDYTLWVFLRRKADRRRLASDQWRLTVLTDNLTKRTSYIDEHNRLIVNGKPFFPLGMYFGALKEDELRQYADSAFNCVMPYGGANAAQMDLLQSLDLKIIYSLKDAYFGSQYCPPAIKSPDDERPFMEAVTKQFRAHPALLAWYLNDELSLDYMRRLEAHQEWMETLDPNHPTWIVLYQVGQLDLYRKTFDVLGTDPYPIPQQPARRAADYTVASVRSVLGSRPIWQVPQVMNWACYKKTEEEKQGLRPPTYDEMRSMTWQCLTEGATGLIYYSWFDLKKEPEVFDRRWEETKRVAAEVKRWVPVLLSIEPAPKIEADKQDWLHWTVRKVGNEVFLFAVNDEEKAREATFTLPMVPRRVKLGNEAVTCRGNELTAPFAPFEMRVYEILP